MKYTNDNILGMNRSTFKKLFYMAVVNVECMDGLKYTGKVEEIGISHDFQPVDIVLKGKKIDILRIKEIEIQGKYDG